jgi:hypothetical protein
MNTDHHALGVQDGMKAVNNINGSPLIDPVAMDQIKHMTPDESVQYLNGWSEGWHRVSLIGMIAFGRKVGEQ